MTFIPVTSSTDYVMDIASGNQSRVKSEIVNCYNENISDKNAPQDIWTNGGEYVFPEKATVLTIKSDSKNDNTGDVGARSITIDGLNLNFEEISETINLKGSLLLPKNHLFKTF